MAVGVVPESQERRHYGGRITAFVVVSCITAGMGGVMFGYDIGVSGGVSSMDAFLRRFFPEVYQQMKSDTRVSNYCRFNSQLLTAFTSSLYVSGLVTTFLASSVTARYGRRASMIVAGAAVIAGATVGGSSVDLSMVILGRVLLGVGLGFGNQAVPLYLSEMAPPSRRGGFSNGFQLCVGLGSLTAQLVNFGAEKIKGGWGWRVSLAVAAVPAGLLTVGALFLPETPNSLVQQGKDHHRVRVLLSLAELDQVELLLDDEEMAHEDGLEDDGDLARREFLLVADVIDADAETAAIGNLFAADIDDAPSSGIAIRCVADLFSLPAVPLLPTPTPPMPRALAALPDPERRCSRLAAKPQLSAVGKAQRVLHKKMGLDFGNMPLVEATKEFANTCKKAPLSDSAINGLRTLLRLNLPSMTAADEALIGLAGPGGSDFPPPTALDVSA